MSHVVRCMQVFGHDSETRLRVQGYQMQANGVRSREGRDTVEGMDTNKSQAVQ